MYPADRLHLIWVASDHQTEATDRHPRAQEGSCLDLHLCFELQRQVDADNCEDNRSDEKHMPRPGKCLQKRVEQHTDNHGQINTHDHQAVLVRDVDADGEPCTRPKRCYNYNQEYVYFLHCFNK